MIGKKFLATTFVGLSLSILVVPVSQAGGIADDDVIRCCELMRDNEDVRNFGMSLIYEKNDVEEVSKMGQEFVDNFALSCEKFVNELKQNVKMQENYELFLKYVKELGFDSVSGERRLTMPPIWHKHSGTPKRNTMPPIWH